MYRTIDTSIWNDQRIRKLDCTAKLLSVYLFTNDRTHITGLYFFSLALASDELSIEISKIRQAFKELCNVGFCRYDEERRVLWVVNMWKRQPHHGVALDRIQNHFLTLNGTPLVGQFLSRYSSYKIPVTKLSLPCHQPVTNDGDEAVTDRLLIGNEMVDKKEKDKEKEKEKEKRGMQGGEDTPSPTAQATKKTQLAGIEMLLPDYQLKHPNLDVSVELEKWKDWMAAKGKTFKSYSAAFRNWLRNAEEFKKNKIPENTETSDQTISHPTWAEIKTLPNEERLRLAQEAKPYAINKCGKREAPDELIRHYMIKLYEADKARAP